MFVPIESSVEKEPASVDDPVTKKLYSHWIDCADGRWAPSWKEIDIMTLPGPLLPYITVCDLMADGDFSYRYWGRGHTDYHGVDYTRKRLSIMRPLWVRDFLMHQYSRVVETRMPLLFETYYERIERPNYSLRLPLSDDGDKVTGLLSIANRRDVSGELKRWIDQQNTGKKLSVGT